MTIGLFHVITTGTCRIYSGKSAVKREGLCYAHNKIIAVVCIKAIGN